MAERMLRLAAVTSDERLGSILDGPGGPPGVQVRVFGGLGAHQNGGPPPQLEAVRDAAPDLVLLDLGPDPALGVRFAQALSDHLPGIPILATGPELTTGMLIAAMRAGVTEYLPAPVQPQELVEAIGRVTRRMTAAHEPPAKVAGEVYAFLPVKGGTGATTAAVNLAVELHRTTGESVLLVDLDLEFGGAALLLGMRPRYSFLDLARNLHRLDAGLLNSFTERHPTGVHVLAAPLRPERSDVLSADEAKRIIVLFRERFRYTVIDMSKSLSPLMSSVLQESNLVIAMTTPDLPTLGSLKRTMPILERLGGGNIDKRLRVVLNRYHPDDSVTVDDVRTLLDTNVDWTLSNDYKAVIRAANDGEPIVLNGRSPYAEDIARIAADLVGEHAKGGEAGRQAPLRRFFGLIQRK